MACFHLSSVTCDNCKPLYTRTYPGYYPYDTSTGTFTDTRPKHEHDCYVCTLERKSISEKLLSLQERVAALEEYTKTFDDVNDVKENSLEEKKAIKHNVKIGDRVVFEKDDKPITGVVLYINLVGDVVVKGYGEKLFLTTLGEIEYDLNYNKDINSYKTTYPYGIFDNY